MNRFIPHIIFLFFTLSNANPTITSNITIPQLYHFSSLHYFVINGSIIYFPTTPMITAVQLVDNKISLWGEVSVPGTVDALIRSENIILMTWHNGSSNYLSETDVLSRLYPSNLDIGNGSFIGGGVMRDNAIFCLWNGTVIDLVQVNLDTKTITHQDVIVTKIPTSFIVDSKSYLGYIIFADFIVQLNLTTMKTDYNITLPIGSIINNKKMEAILSQKYLFLPGNKSELIVVNITEPSNMSLSTYPLVLDGNVNAFDIDEDMNLYILWKSANESTLQVARFTPNGITQNDTWSFPTSVNWLDIKIYQNSCSAVALGQDDENTIILKINLRNSSCPTIPPPPHVNLPPIIIPWSDYTIDQQYDYLFEIMGGCGGGLLLTILIINVIVWVKRKKENEETFKRIVDREHLYTTDDDRIPDMASDRY